MTENHSSRRLASRRHFLKTSSAALFGGALAPHLSFPAKSFAANSDTLRLGLIGCGGRGTGAAGQALAADKNVILTAMGDAFAERLQNSREILKKQADERVQVTPDHCYVGFDAYQKVIDSGVDVVLLATPPGFRPAHLKAAVAAGKHVFCEKPMAVDAPGLRSVLDSAEEAKRKKLSLVSGFCWRYDYPKRAAYELIHEGKIGEIRAVYATFLTGSIWSRPRQPNWTDMEWQMRNWYYFTWLSGDHLVEQAVHSVDKIAWAMKDQPPLRAVALGGRQVRTDPLYGHIYDHFSVMYEYPDGSRGFLFTRQQDQCWNENNDHILGTKGICDITGGQHVINGESNWRYPKSAPKPNMYQVEHDELFASIRSGKPINDGVWMAQSTMMAILGRMAAYTGQTITWEQALNSQENIIPEKLAWDYPLSVPPVAIPGRTKFV